MELSVAGYSVGISFAFDTDVSYLCRIYVYAKV